VESIFGQSRFRCFSAGLAQAIGGVDTYYEQELNRGYECQLFALPSPIAVSGDLKRIINVSVGAMNLESTAIRIE